MTTGSIVMSVISLETQNKGCDSIVLGSNDVTLMCVVKCASRDDVIIPIGYIGKLMRSALLLGSMHKCFEINQSEG